jgi:hypothetical protein
MPVKVSVYVPEHLAVKMAAVPGFNRSAIARGAWLRALDPEKSKGRPKTATRGELLELLTEAARAGNVSAARALLEALRRDVHGSEHPQSPSVIDELSRRRGKDRGTS